MQNAVSRFRDGIFLYKKTKRYVLLPTAYFLIAYLISVRFPEHPNAEAYENWTRYDADNMNNTVI